MASKIRVIFVLLFFIVVPFNLQAQTGAQASFYFGDYTLYYGTPQGGAGRVYNGSATTFTYTLCRPGSVEYFDTFSLLQIGVASCIPPSSVVNCGVASCVPVLDSATQLLGITYSSSEIGSFDSESCKTLSFTIPGDVPEQLNSAYLAARDCVAPALKTSQDERIDCETRPILGPGCGPDPAIVTCDAGGTIGGTYGVNCNSAKVSLKMNITGTTSQPALGLRFELFTNCPNGSFSSNVDPNATLAFDALKSNGSPANCVVQVMASSGLGNAQCSSVVNVVNCAVDCRGKTVGPALLDRCGVCEGDGQSCLQCQNKDATGTIIALDGNAQSQAALVRQTGKRIISARHSSSINRRRAKRIIEQAAKVAADNWATAWRLPQTITTCGSKIFCAPRDHSDTTASYLKGSQRLDALLRALVRLLRESSGDSSLGGSLLKDGRRLHQQNIDLLEGLPSSSDICPN